MLHHPVQVNPAEGVNQIARSAMHLDDWRLWQDKFVLVPTLGSLQISLFCHFSPQSHKPVMDLAQRCLGVSELHGLGIGLLQGLMVLSSFLIDCLAQRHWFVREMEREPWFLFESTLRMI